MDNSCDEYISKIYLNAKDLIKQNERYLTNTEFCKWYREMKGTCVGCSSHKGCAIGLLMSKEILEEMHKLTSLPDISYFLGRLNGFYNQARWNYERVEDE